MRSNWSCSPSMRAKMPAAFGFGFCAAIAMSTLTVAQEPAYDSCNTLTLKVNKLRAQFDLLKLDYPFTFAYVCGTVKGVISQPNPDPGTVVAQLGLAYLGCGVLFGEQDCNYVIGEFTSIVQGYGAVSSFAEENKCAKPTLPDPC